MTLGVDQEGKIVALELDDPIDGNITLKFKNLSKMLPNPVLYHKFKD